MAAATDEATEASVEAVISASAVADTTAGISANAVADAGATLAALVTTVAAASDEATEADPSVEAVISASAVADTTSVISANAVGDAGATPAALVTVAATTEADLSVVAATSANAVADAGATLAALVTTMAATTGADLSEVAATSATNAVVDAAAGTSAQIIKSISDYNPPLDELLKFSTAVVNQLQQKLHNFENGKSLWTTLLNKSQEVVLLSKESEVNAPKISHSQSGSGTTSISQVVAVALVNNLEENDKHIRESILPPAMELSKLFIWMPKGMNDLSNRDNVMAICLSQAFILYSWPRQQKLPQFDRMKDIVQKLIAADFSGARPAAEATVASTNEQLLSSIQDFVLEIGSISINDQLSESRRSSTSSQPAPIQMDCVQEAIAINVQTLPAAHFNEKILFSVQVQLNTNDLSQRRIPLSFPVTIGSEKVIFQLLAATFVKVKKVTTTLIRFINRYGVHNCGRYIVMNTDGKVKTKLDNGLLFVENEFFVRNLVFVKGNLDTQNEFSAAYKLKEEALFISHSISVDGDKLFKFMHDNDVFVEDDIIQSYCSRVAADFQKIEAISSLNPHQRSSIVFPVQFTNNIAEIFSRKATNTMEPISESEKKDLVENYMNSLIGDKSLNESTILHVVVNLDNLHWNYFTVVFSTCTICVWDSLLSVEDFEDTKKALLQNLFTVFTWEYERRNKKKLSGDWQRKDLIVPQQEEDPKVFCGVYCMVFLMRGFLEGLYSDAPFSSHLDLSGGGKKSFEKKLVKNLRSSIADVITGSSTVLSIMSFFVEEFMYKSVHKNLMHKHYFTCKKWLPEPAYHLFEPKFKLFNCN